MVKNREPVKQDIRRLYIEEDEKLEEHMGFRLRMS